MKPTIETDQYTLYLADCLDALRAMPAESANCCITSPPYWGLRDYGHDDQIGLEEAPEAYVEKMVQVFAEVRRVLKDDGTLWLNLGDSYAGSGKGSRSGVPLSEKQASNAGSVCKVLPVPETLKPKDLVGIPWRVAFALQADGWYLRQDIIWHKPNPMPESVADRCTKSHEYVFLLSKSARYHYDHEAIKEPAGDWKGDFEADYKRSQYRNNKPRKSKKRGEFNGKTNALKGREAFRAVTETRNKRDVWTVATRPYKGAHFAVFPEKLIEPCVLAGCPKGGNVLDPFTGSGTTGIVALEHGCNFIGSEINPDYFEIARERLEHAASQRRLFA